MIFSSKASRLRFNGLGKAGDDEKGSKAGSSEETVFFDAEAGDAGLAPASGNGAIEFAEIPNSYTNEL